MRQIDWEQPLSDDDRAWAVQAGSPTINALLAENEARFAGGVDEVDPTTAPEDTPDGAVGIDPPARDDDGDDYDDWDVPELRKELEDRGVEYKPKTPKNGLISLLRKNDTEAAEADAE